MQDKIIRVSILGDSISTFKGYNPPGYFVYYDEITQEQNKLRNVYGTWWAKVNQFLRAHLCVNDSYSGSMVTGNRFPAVVSDRRLNYLGTSDCDPDIILIYIGFNDFGEGVRINSEHPDAPVQIEVFVKFTIDPEGKVTRVEIQSSNSENEEFDKAICDEVSTWTFEKADSESKVTLPFKFKKK